MYYLLARKACVVFNPLPPLTVSSKASARPTNARAPAANTPTNQSQPQNGDAENGRPGAKNESAAAGNINHSHTILK